MKILLTFILSLPLLAFGWEANENHTGDTEEHMDSTLDDAETRGVKKGDEATESDEDAEVRREGGSDTEERLGAGSAGHK